MSPRLLTNILAELQLFCHISSVDYWTVYFIDLVRLAGYHVVVTVSKQWVWQMWSIVVLRGDMSCSASSCHASPRLPSRSFPFPVSFYSLPLTVIFLIFKSLFSGHVFIPFTFPSSPIHPLFVPSPLQHSSHLLPLLSHTLPPFILSLPRLFSPLLQRCVAALRGTLCCPQPLSAVLRVLPLWLRLFLSSSTTTTLYYPPLLTSWQVHTLCTACLPACLEAFSSSVRDWNLMSVLSSLSIWFVSLVEQFAWNHKVLPLWTCYSVILFFYALTSNMSFSGEILSLFSLHVKYGWS